MATPEEKKRWREEATQLNKDLKNRKKVVIKNEVSLSFPKKHTQKTSAPTHLNESLVRQQLHIHPMDMPKESD